MLNFDTLAKNHPVYAIDLLGFGKSSRPKFSKDAKEIIMQYVNSIEKWRESMRIEKMILLGHSFGGYLSTAYSIKFPGRIEHLVLAGKFEGYFLCVREIGRVFRFGGRVTKWLKVTG